MRNPVSGAVVAITAILSLSCQGNRSPSTASTVGPSDAVAAEPSWSSRPVSGGVPETGGTVETADNAWPVLTLHTHPGAVNGRIWTTGLVTFNLCDSSDPDQNPDHPELGDTLNWQFNFGDSGMPAFNPDGTFNADVGHVCRTEHTYAEGRYTATVTVTDQHLEDQGHDVSSLARTTQTVIVISSQEPPPVARGCYDAAVPGYFDQSFNGRLNQPDNAVVWWSEDGTCSGSSPAWFPFSVPYPVMWVRTDETTRAGVLAFCQSIRSNYRDPIHLADAGFRVPDDLWACR